MQLRCPLAEELVYISVLAGQCPAPMKPVYSRAPATGKSLRYPMKVHTRNLADGELVKMQVSEGLDSFTRELLEASAAMGRSLGTYSAGFNKDGAAAEDPATACRSPPLLTPPQNAKVAMSTGREQVVRPSSQLVGRMVVIGNLPSWPLDWIVALLDGQCLRGAYEVVSMPTDTEGRSSGRATVRFGSHEIAAAFISMFHNMAVAPFTPEKPCKAFWSRTEEVQLECTPAPSPCAGKELHPIKHELVQPCSALCTRFEP